MMKFFFKIKKKWLQHRVYKYTLKYEGSMSKSKYYADMCGSCDYMTNVTTVRCERGHICGMHND